MGLRKKIKALFELERQAAKITRDKKKQKRGASEKTAGQKLHDKMHGRV